MQIILNGTSRTIDTSLALQDLLATEHLLETPCAVEINGRVIPWRDHASHLLEADDVIEVVTLVGGG